MFDKTWDIFVEHEVSGGSSAEVLPQAVVMLIMPWRLDLLKSATSVGYRLEILTIKPSQASLRWSWLGSRKS